MASRLNSRLLSSYRAASRVASGAVFAVGMLVLAGWLFDIPALKSVVPGLATMKANSALAFILCGISLWSLDHKQMKKPIRLLANACAAIVLLIAVLTLGEYLSNRDFGIDQLLFQDTTAASGTSFPGRMSPAAALNFLLLGSALLLMDNRWRNWLHESLTLTALIIAGTAAIGYIYGVSSFYQIGVYSSIALHTALTFILLCLGILYARPEYGLISILRTEGAAGILARRLLPAAIGIPIALGWLFLTGQRTGYYDTAFGIALFALSNIIAFAALIWWNTHMLHRAEAKRGQAETALSMTEQRSRALLENSWDAIALFGADGTILYGSPSTVQILGYSLDEFVGRNAFELIHAEDQALVTERMTMSLQQPGAHIPIYARVLHKNGEWRWLEGVFTNLLDEPSVQAIVNNYHDFTERKQDEDALRESEAHKSAILESALDCVITIDHQGHILEFNPAAQAVFGYTAAEAVEREMAELIIPPSLREQHRRGLATYLATGEGPVLDKRIELIGMRADGDEFPVELTITRIKGEGSPVFTGFLRDITERKQAEAALQRLNDELEIQVQERTAALSQANALLQMLLDHMPDHIYFKDAQSRFIRNSRSQATALGLSDPAEVVGKSDFDFFPHAPLSYEKEQEIIRSGEPLVDLEERVVWPDGRETWVSTTKMPLLDQAGQIVGTFGISRDITDRKRAEVALQKTKLELEAANKELEAFAYSVSHDLRAPLRSMDGFSQAILEDYGALLPPEGRDFLDRIRSSAQRMAELIDDLLNLSKVTRALMRFVSVDLSGLAKNITAELERTHPERNVRWSIAPNLRSHGDPNLLRVVLENLLNNGLKYTSKQEQAQIEFGSKYENDETVYFVRDNGAGFDMAFVGKLFGAFQRLHAMTEFPGTGIGLATVQRIIHRHGGRVWAEGAVDQGATFFFTLPALERAKPEALPQEKESLAERIKEII